MSLGAPDPSSATATSEPGAAPWAADLEQLTDDPDQRAAFDQYLRSRWQPRMTQLEQQAQVSQDALNLWNALGENPSETLVAVVDQMFDSESAQKIYSALNGEQGAAAQQQAQEVVQQAAAETTPQEYAKLDPQTQQLIDGFAQEQNEKAYWKEVDAALQTNHDLNGDQARKHVHSFIAAANGDVGEGFARYRAFLNDFGVPATDAQVEANAPTVMGSDGATTNGAPLEHKPTWDEAFKNFEQTLADNNGRPAPPVGTA